MINVDEILRMTSEAAGSTSRRRFLLGSGGLGAALVGGSLAVPGFGSSVLNKAEELFQNVRNQRFFGLAVEGDAENGLSAALSRGDEIGRRPDLVGVFQEWADTSGFPTTAADRARDAGSTLCVTWQPWAHGVTDPASNPFRLSSIVRGEHDGLIRTWAEGAAQHGRIVYVRFGHEMNGAWFPWGNGPGSEGAQMFVRAHRHVHELVRSAGADNVRFIWCPNVVTAGQENAAIAAFPGTDVVDIVGVDGYAAQSDHLRTSIDFRWHGPEDTFGPTFDLMDRIAGSLPMWICETGCAGGSSDRAQWAASLVDYLASTRVTGLTWFDVHTATADWSLADPKVRTAFGEALDRW